MIYSLRKSAEEYDRELEKQLTSFLNWVFKKKYYPDGLLPASFQVRNVSLGTSPIITSNEKWRLPLKISPPDDRLTSTYFGIYHPDALHDFFLALKELDLDVILKQSERITSYSLPLQKRGEESEGIRGASDYLRLESDLSSDAYAFNTLIKLDIKQCYPSIYSHSIHWAIDGYEKVRKEDPLNLTVHFNKKGKGHKIDTSIQAINGGFTKGLVVGPGASDIIAEILLRQVDREISEVFENKGISAFGGRYKDDYRILLNDSSSTESVIKIVEEVLKKYLLYLNADKTSDGKTFELLQRDWMVEYNSVLSIEEEAQTHKHFLWHLACVADLQRKYPGRKLLAKFLTDTKYRPDNKQELHQITSVLLSLSDIFRSVVPYSISYIEKAAESINDHGVNDYIIKKIKCEFNEHNAIWYLYFLSNYLEDYASKIGSEVNGKFSNNPFWKSLWNQSDHVFSDRILSGDYFISTKGQKLYEQTKYFADIYF